MVLYEGDFLTEHLKIKKESVDLILTDPPYGTVKGLDLDGWQGGSKTNWDVAIDPSDIFKVADLILRPKGKLILFSQEPYTSRLIRETIPNIEFNYRCIWLKDHFANALSCNKAPVSFYEDIIVFTKSESYERNPVKDYTDKIREFIGLTNPEIFKDFENAGFNKYAVLDTFNSDTARRYNPLSERTYKALIELYAIDKMPGFIPYSEMRESYEDSKPRSIFNLSAGDKYKSNILKYKKDYDGHHPTQKPILLLEDLVNTYTKVGDTVADLTMGSGSTGVACANTCRRFVGIEKDPQYFKIAQNRIYGAQEYDLI